MMKEWVEAWKEILVKDIFSKAAEDSAEKEASRFEIGEKLVYRDWLYDTILRELDEDIQRLKKSLTVNCVHAPKYVTVKHETYWHEDSWSRQDTYEDRFGVSCTVCGVKESYVYDKNARKWDNEYVATLQKKFDDEAEQIRKQRELEEATEKEKRLYLELKQKYEEKIT